MISVLVPTISLYKGDSACSCINVNVVILHNALLPVINLQWQTKVFIYRTTSLAFAILKYKINCHLQLNPYELSALSVDYPAISTIARS